MKILVTTGTGAEYSFHRLLKIIDSLCDKKVIDPSKLVVQSINKDYIPRNYKLHQMMSNDMFQIVMSEADIIISHAGTGTVTTALKMKKKMILFPRLKDYGEHIDDHQLQLCKLFTEKGYVMNATNEEELEDCVKNSDSFIPEVFVSNTDNFVNKICKIIDSFNKEMKNEI